MRYGILFCTVALAAYSTVAGAQKYPDKPLRMIVPFAPGGGTDIVARRIAQKLTEGLGQQVVVDNRGGAGGVLGADLAARAAPDGYTIILVSGSYAVNPSLYKLSFDPVDGISPIGLVGMSADLLAVYPGVPVNTTQELIALAKARPGKLNYGSTGVGGFTHLATELFKMMTQTDMVHVPYKGTGPAMADLLGGQVQLLMGGIASELPFVRSGRLKGLGVTTPKRLPGVPDIPTIAETVPGYEAVLWYGVWGPPKLPREVVTRISDELKKIVAIPATREQLSQEGVDAEHMAPEEFRKFLRAEIAKWAKVVKAAGVKGD
ncbi:MAG TPA: tripartite tricarboxylate transporter substrate binding protein [Burkholderiales bacterium]|nr:tripartite tricarboxylate transporter substrate binding protein [Burkholderiales bacterium]